MQHLLQLSVGLLAQLSANTMSQFSPEKKSASKQNEFAPTYIGTEGHILRAFCLKPVFSISHPSQHIIILHAPFRCIFMLSYSIWVICQKNQVLLGGFY